MDLDTYNSTGQPQELDDPLNEHLLFTKLVSDALLRNGITMPRLLIMHSPEVLRERIRSLNRADIEEIEAKLALAGWRLARHADRRQVDLIMDVITTLRAARSSLRLPQLMDNLRLVAAQQWTESEVRQVLAQHPYCHRVAQDAYQFSIADGQEFVGPGPEPSHAAPVVVPPAQDSPLAAGTPSVRVPPVWQEWSSYLSGPAQRVITGLYGVENGTPLTLQEVGEQLGISKERVRQVREASLARLRNSTSAAAQQAARALLTSALHDHDNLLTPAEWNRWLDTHEVWKDALSQPFLLFLFCALFSEFTYVKRYDVVIAAPTLETGIDFLDHTARRLLREQGSRGLYAGELVHALRHVAQTSLPASMLTESFLLKAVRLFDQIEQAADGRYCYQRNYQRKKSSRQLEAAADGAGPRLHEWEMRLRAQFSAITWIGQANLSPHDFTDLCQAIQEEARGPNYFSKQVEAQPNLAPPAVFATSMVLSARFAELQPDEAIDEFWTPYLRTVWGVEYSQSFYARCKKHFNEAAALLADAFGFEFPRTGKGGGEAVTPVFRHALIPSYMQSDFAQWMCKNWCDILTVSADPDLLAAYLRRDKTLDGYSHRLRQFITGNTTIDAAMSLITNMAAAISLFVHDSEDPRAIDDLLSGTPIEQELWRQIHRQLAGQGAEPTAAGRTVRPKVTWVWSLDRAELNLRVQNIVVPAGSALHGTPDRLAWLASPAGDPLHPDAEVQVTPWRMQTGERVIHDAVFPDPDGPAGGAIVLLTNADEAVQTLEVPSLPGGKLRFFRAAQQDTYGLPVELNQVTDGEWLVCAEGPLTFLDDLDVVIAPQEILAAPYPLDRTFRWAARIHLALPARVMAGESQVVLLEARRGQEGAHLPFVAGATRLPGLLPSVQPTFATPDVTLHVDGDGERLLKQATLWLQGDDGRREQVTLANLHAQGLVQITDDGLQVNLDPYLSPHPNLYSLELRDSLRPIYPAPTLFAVVPGLSVEPPARDRLYTPADPPSAHLFGLDESCIVRNKAMAVAPLPGGGVAVTWYDLRYDPHLLLRFGSAAVPLAWSAPRFATWLDPQPPQPFVTLEQLQQTTLHAASSVLQLDSFELCVPDQRCRRFPLQRGRYSGCLGQTQLNDMLRYAQGPHIPVTVRVGKHTWSLANVHKRPDLASLHLHYDRPARVLSLFTGLQEEWPGSVRFLAESLVNPFAPAVELGRATALQAQHQWHADLPAGIYLLQIELEGVNLPTTQERLRFRVGKTADYLEQPQQLIDEVRSGQLISCELAEDFVLWWADIAECEKTELTPATLYQLATAPAAALGNFEQRHLRKLWPPLAAIHAVHSSEWVAKHGLLPAEIFLTQPIMFKAAGNGHRWPVIPVYWGHGGRSGRGYAHWYLSPVEGTPKSFVYAEWEPADRTTVLLKAGLPKATPLDWDTADLIEMYDLYLCERCGSLCGEPNIPLTESLRNQHRHGQREPVLKAINVPAAANGYELRAEWYIDRHADLLSTVHTRHGVVGPSPSVYLPEPAAAPGGSVEVNAQYEQFTTLVRNVQLHGESSDERSPLAGAARLLDAWNAGGSVSTLGRAVFALSMVLRFAAAHRPAYAGLRKSLQLGESELQDDLALLHRLAPAHVEWGLTWAELVMTHSLSHPT